MPQRPRVGRRAEERRPLGREEKKKKTRRRESSPRGRGSASVSVFLSVRVVSRVVAGSLFFLNLARDSRFRPEQRSRTRSPSARTRESATAPPARGLRRRRVIFQFFLSKASSAASSSTAVDARPPPQVTRAFRARRLLVLCGVLGRRVPAARVRERLLGAREVRLDEENGDARGGAAAVGQNDLSGQRGHDALGPGDGLRLCLRLQMGRRPRSHRHTHTRPAPCETF